MMALTLGLAHMAGDILYFLHRHFRVVFVIGVALGVMTFGMFVKGALWLTAGA